MIRLRLHTGYLICNESVNLNLELSWLRFCFLDTSAAWQQVDCLRTSFEQYWTQKLLSRQVLTYWIGKNPNVILSFTPFSTKLPQYSWLAFGQVHKFNDSWCPLDIINLTRVFINLFLDIRFWDKFYCQVNDTFIGGVFSIKMKNCESGQRQAQMAQKTDFVLLILFRTDL